MSWTQAPQPQCRERDGVPTIATVIVPRARNIGAFEVRRVLPSSARRMVGPFIFFDEMGPAVLEPGDGMDILPHPHINLATVTYLFEGEIMHRDSLGSEQRIRPGAINWMTAGRGIAHSERTPDDIRDDATRVHGIQLWVALPTEHEDTAPAFAHHPAETLPVLVVDGVQVRVLVGEVYGVASPVQVLSPTFFVDADMPASASLRLPPEQADRAIYIVSGRLGCAGEQFEAGRMIVFIPGADASVEALEDTQLVMLGGAPVDGPRHIWWNFVSSSPQRIEQAKRDWEQGRFPHIPGESDELAEMPER